jgi:hypothetical protein
MSRNSILRKLKQELHQDITTECQVVYVLVEIRKAIDQAGDLENYRALDFYCSFALHTRMGRVGARRILERFDKAYPLWISEKEVPRDLQNEIDQTTKLKRFRDEMKAFVTDNGLPTRLFEEPDAWARFIHLYGNIIDECELVLKGDGVKLQFIDRVVVHLEMATRALQTDFGNQVLFRICWTCHGKDGTSGDYFVIFGFDASS